MTEIYTLATAILAQAGPAAPPKDGAPPGQGGLGGGISWTMITLWLPLLLLFYFLMIRPQRKEQSTRAKMLANLKKTDRVVTVGGVYGVVANVNREADEVTLKIDEATNTRIRVTLGAISRVMEDKPSGSETAGS